MSLRRACILFAAGVSSSLLAGFAVAGSSSATTSDTVTESSEVVSDMVGETGVTPTSGATDDAGVATTPEAAAVEILPPDESWGGATLGEWGARWWQWTHSMPDAVNPNLDRTGEHCGYGQSGPVFLLPANFVGATPLESPCVVAEGTAIYVFVAGTQCSNVEEPPFFGGTEEELRACAEAHPPSSVSGADELTSYEARVNGQQVADLEAYRTVTPLFTLTFADDNLLGVEPGVAQAMSLDYGFIIAPPPPGEYVIDISTTIAGQPALAYTITVMVEAPQAIESPPITT